MAYIFSLSVECGRTEEAALAVAEYFRDFEVRLPDGACHHCEVGTGFEGGGWWAMVWPEGVSRSGLGQGDETRTATAIGFALYDKLRKAPPYRYALVGVEVDGFRYFEELDEDVVNRDFNGLVLADEVWEHLGSPDVFVPFEPGYRWRPFVQAR